LKVVHGWEVGRGGWSVTGGGAWGRQGMRVLKEAEARDWRVTAEEERGRAARSHEGQGPDVS
jgi:hypothetical protein